MFNQFFRRAFGASLALSLSLVAGCGSNGMGTQSAEASQKKIKVVVTTPPPSTSGTTTVTTTTVAEPVVSPNGLVGETAVPDNFNTASGISPTAYANTATGSPTGGLPNVSPDNVGAFRIVCNGDHLAYDDPLALPGQPGKSHLHQFWGNSGTNANSTYQSLRTSGGTSCGNSSTPINRTAYWMPAMLDGAGNAVVPDLVHVYYKQYPASSADCAGAATACIELPSGIRYIFGYNMSTKTGGPNDLSSPDQYAMYYQCWADSVGTLAVPGRFQNIADVVKAGCPAGAKLIVAYFAPTCWDGQNLDTADHRSHMSNWMPGTAKCPADHPYLIPSWQGRVQFTTDANFVAGKWHLSSDDMLAQMTGQPVVPGSTLHFDYWEAWSPTIKKTWQADCIDAHMSCAGGDLGNGTAISGVSDMTHPTHKLVALSSIPTS